MNAARYVSAAAVNTLRAACASSSFAKRFASRSSVSPRLLASNSTGRVRSEENGHAKEDEGDPQQIRHVEDRTPAMAHVYMTIGLKRTAGNNRPRALIRPEPVWYCCTWPLVVSHGHGVGWSRPDRRAATGDDIPSSDRVVPEAA